MKNLLFIIHLPRASPRVEGLVKYFHEFEWQPIILTGTTSRYSDLPARIIETPYRDSLGFLGQWLKINPERDAGQQIKGRLGVTSGKSPIDLLFNLGGAIINYPCPNKNWKPFAVSAAKELIEKENIDAVLSSSAPLTSHLIANELKAEYHIPWIADLRDLWSQNHNYSYGPLRKIMDRRLEVKTLAGADALITVSGPWAEKLRALHKGKKVYSITHGFNPAEVNILPAKLTAKFTITYTGTIYPGRQNPSRFLASLRGLISDGTINKDDIEVRFFGPVEKWLAKEIKKYQLSDIVKQYGQVSRHIAVEKQQESQLLLFLNWDDPKEQGVFSGKIFEYLGARRPILATGGSKGDVVTELLNETKSGMTASGLEDIKGLLKELYREYKMKGEIAFGGEESKINQYTQREMARKFSDILDNLVV